MRQNPGGRKNSTDESYIGRQEEKEAGPSQYGQKTRGCRDFPEGGNILIGSKGGREQVQKKLGRRGGATAAVRSKRKKKNSFLSCLNSVGLKKGERATNWNARGTPAGSKGKTNLAFTLPQTKKKKTQGRGKRAEIQTTLIHSLFSATQLALIKAKKSMGK